MKHSVKRVAAIHDLFWFWKSFVDSDHSHPFIHGSAGLSIADSDPFQSYWGI